VGVGAAGGAEDEDLFDVGQVAQRGGVPGAAAGADGGEQDQARAGEVSADLAVVRAELVDDLLVERVGHTGSLSWVARDGTRGNTGETVDLGPTRGSRQSRVPHS
jgi:hypothetical protein